MSELRAKLQPGDIMLERRNWYLSNAFLPGYWPHAAIYIGTADDLKKLGLDQDERVKKHWAEFVKRDEQGHEHVILESVSEGVVFTSFERSVGEADSAAFLRTRLEPARVRECIARAFSHAGKPYDFEFDFFSTDKLVCTELVFRSFDGDIQFPLVEIMGASLRTKESIVQGESEGKSFYEIIDASQTFGWRTFDQSCLEAYKSKIITEETAIMQCSKRGVMSRGIDLIKKERGEQTTNISDLRMAPGDLHRQSKQTAPPPAGIRMK